MPVVETFFGYVETTKDSLLLLEACRRGVLPRVGRRLQEQERHLVKSGAVFCFDENESGIKRWTDGLVWSPSRILGNFLIYRELGNRRNSSDEDDEDQQHSLDQITSGLTLLSKRQREKSLVGSLRNSYQFKPDGLIKKSMSIVVNGVHQHLISYYNKDDVLTNKFQTPSIIPELATLIISPELLFDQHFRIPFIQPDESNGTNIRISGAERPIKQKKRSASQRRTITSQRHCKMGNRSSISTSNKMVYSASLNQSTTSDLVQEDMQQIFSTTLPSTKPASIVMNQRHFSDSAIYSRSYHTSHNLSYQPQETSQDGDLFMTNLLTSPGTQPPSTKYPPSIGYQESQNKLTMIPVSQQYHRDIQQQQQRQHLNTLPDRISFGVGSDYQPWIPHSFSTGYSTERSDQNPHQHLFSSSSFHAINHASLHAGRELVSNAFMLDTNALLGSGWNDFELQM